MTNTKKTKEKPLDLLKQYGLTLQQEMFCQYFTSPTEFYGNGVQSYASAYNIDLTDIRAYNSCKSRASGLLTNIDVIARINSLLDINGFNDQNVDKQLLLLISQSADFNSKLGAIREYNKLKARITEKMEHVVNAPVAIIQIMPAQPKHIADAVDVTPVESAAEVKEISTQPQENNVNPGYTTTDDAPDGIEA